MSGKSLDRRLSQAFLHLLEINAPSWTHQEEVYQYVEQQVEFTENQLALHVQRVGQIEPNWQHDLRNLQHTLKRNGTVINPERELWALPVEKVELRDVHHHWHECVLAATGSTDNMTSLTTHTGQIIDRQLFIERIHHLLQCGGLLPRGRMHNWSRIEQALIEISPRLEMMHNWIVWAPTFDEIERENLSLVVQNVINNVKQVDVAGKSAVHFRTKKKRGRRTMSELPDENLEPHDIIEGIHPLTIPHQSAEPRQLNTDHVNFAGTNSNLEGYVVDVETRSEQEADIEQTDLEEDETDHVLYDVCTLNPEKGFHNSTYEEFTHRIDAPPGLGRKYFCPLCGCPFIATQRDRLIFFRHAGGNHLSERKTFEAWPEKDHGTWSDVKRKLNYIGIHNAFGDNLTDVREASRRTVRESLQLNMTIGYFYNDVDENQTLLIFFDKAGEGADWKVIVESGDEKEFNEYDDEGQCKFYIELPENTPSITLCPPDMPHMTLTLPPARLIMDAESVDDARVFSLVEPQYRWEDATGSMLIRTEDHSQGVITIGGQAYKTATNDDRYSIRIGLPHFDGQVILPEGEERLPLVFQEGGEWSETPSHRISLQTSDLEPFFLPREHRVVLNSERLRRNQNLAPRVQIRIPEVSQTISLESYPLSFREIQPSSVFLDIDGIHHPIGNAIEVNQKPNSICLVAQEKTINLEQHHAKLWYKNHLDGSGIKFQEGPLNEMLETLQTLTEHWFVLSFEMNRSKQVYDRQTIMMKPIPPLKEEEVKWYGIGGRKGKKWWSFIVQNSSKYESANARLLEERTEIAGCPKGLKEFILENKSEMVTWLTNHRRQRT